MATLKSEIDKIPAYTPGPGKMMEQRNTSELQVNSFNKKMNIFAKKSIPNSQKRRAASNGRLYS